MGDVKLSAPHLRIIRENVPDPLEVQTDNRDMLLWERTRRKHNWPKFDEAPLMWLTFLGWAAARRTGAIPPDLTWERWESEVIDVSSEDEAAAAEDTEDDFGTPTLPGLEPG